MYGNFLTICFNQKQPQGGENGSWHALSKENNKIVLVRSTRPRLKSGAYRELPEAKIRKRTNAGAKNLLIKTVLEHDDMRPVKHKNRRSYVYDDSSDESGFLDGDNDAIHVNMVSNLNIRLNHKNRILT